jgi:hypothetical protein
LSIQPVREVFEVFDLISIVSFILLFFLEDGFSGLDGGEEIFGNLEVAFLCLLLDATPADLVELHSTHIRNFLCEVKELQLEELNW